ncbi:cysteine desulfurase [Candidatus Bathyarchaeota archaeon]|nr:cysteine desulfurase [Candidatus Bathyarchaeota archaeon]
MFNVYEVRRDFPILEKGIIYLDNAASSLTPEQVVQKEVEYYHEYRANVERGLHRLSQRASEEYEKAHEIVAELIGARSAKCIAMTKNTTEGINLVAYSRDWRRGDKIVTTLIEHHSNFITWLRVARRHGCKIEVVRPDREGRFDLADFEKAIDDRTRLVAVTRVSNVLGCIVPVKEVASIAHEHGALVLEDGAQGVPHLKTNVMDSDVDFLAFSGHKMLGPTGSGALYIAEEELYSTEPLCIGGGTISDVEVSSYMLAEPPLRFEAGTPAIAQAIGLGEACRYLMRIGMNLVESWDAQLSERLVEGLSNIEGVEVYGPTEPKERVGIVSFNIKGMNPHDVALILDSKYNIAVRSGHHCALPLMKELLGNPDGTVRASTYLYNTPEEIDRLIDAVKELVKS